MGEIKAKRIEYLDIAKGIGILLVILAHIDEGYTKIPIYAFHLPLFFVISGICFRCEGTFWDFFKKKAKGYLVPYFGMGLVLVLFKSFVLEQGVSAFGWNLGSLLVQIRYGTIWFLAALFFAVLLFWGICRLCRNQPGKILLISLSLSVLGVWYEVNIRQPLPWNVDTAVVIQGFLGLGYYIKKKNILAALLELPKYRKLEMALTFFMICMALTWLNYQVTGEAVEMFFCEYGYYGFTYLAACFGVGAVLLFSSMIHSRYLSYVGRCSMVFFIWHQWIFMPVAEWILGFAGLSKWSRGWGEVWFKGLSFVLVLGMATVVDWLIRKTKVKVLLG